MAELVGELWACLVLPEPGLGCALVQALTATSGAPPQHYLGILHTLTAGSQVRFTALWASGHPRTLQPAAARSTRAQDQCNDADLQLLT